MSENKKKRRVFPRYPLPNKEKLKRNLMRFAEEHKDGDYNWQIYACLRGVVGDILTSRELIEDTNKRESKRIEKALKAIEIVLDLIEDPAERKRVEKDIRDRL